MSTNAEGNLIVSKKRNFTYLRIIAVELATKKGPLARPCLELLFYRHHIKSHIECRARAVADKKTNILVLYLSYSHDNISR